MTISLETIYLVAGILSILGALYYTIKKTGAMEMKTNVKIEELEKSVEVLTTRLATVEACGGTNNYDIGIIKTDLEWIKKGVEEIKGLLGNRRAE